MIYNCTLTRIDRATEGAIGGSAPTFAAGASVEVRCAVDKVTRTQRYEVGAVIQDASQFMLLEKRALEAAGEARPGPGDRLVLVMDGEASQVGEVVDDGDRVHGHQSHFEIYLKDVT